MRFAKRNRADLIWIALNAEKMTEKDHLQSKIMLNFQWDHFFFFIE